MSDKKPDLYLDVDGVLLLGWDAAGNRIENTWLVNMLLGSLDQFDRVFWLSCWTGGGSADRLYEKHPRFRDFGATVVEWGPNKTDGIDWSRPFLWIEDGFGGEEAEAFKAQAVDGQYIWQVRLGVMYENFRKSEARKK